jgi:hypothetical protein
MQLYEAKNECSFMQFEHGVDLKYVFRENGGYLGCGWGPRLISIPPLRITSFYAP